MLLDLPVVSETTGPEWASMLNDAIELIDSHNHTSGRGFPVPVDGIDIDEDFPVNSFNLIYVRSTRYDDQASPLAESTDTGITYVSGGNLWYNDASGNQVQLTAGGALNAASIGAIGGDYATSTASVFYDDGDKTFYFWQDSNESANIDAGNVIIRQPGLASAKGVTLKSTTSLASDYTLILPVPTGTTRLLQMNGSGTITVSTSITDFTITNLTSTNGLFNSTLETEELVVNDVADINELSVGGLLDVNANAEISGTLAVTGVTTISANLALSMANPASTTAQSNVINKGNTVKAWARITTGATPAVNGGFNIASVAYVGAGGSANKTLAITFASAMANANYAVAVSGNGLLGGMIVYPAGLGAFVQTTTVCYVNVTDLSDVAQDLSANSLKINVVVLGLQ
jgi:hypothetical protein